MKAQNPNNIRIFEYTLISEYYGHSDIRTLRTIVNIRILKLYLSGCVIFRASEHLKNPNTRPITSDNEKDPTWDQEETVDSAVSSESRSTFRGGSVWETDRSFVTCVGKFPSADVSRRQFLPRTTIARDYLDRFRPVPFIGPTTDVGRPRVVRTGRGAARPRRHRRPRSAA